MGGVPGSSGGSIGSGAAQGTGATPGSGGSNPSSGGAGPGAGTDGGGSDSGTTPSKPKLDPGTGDWPVVAPGDVASVCKL
ncbi:MAG TPA: hypothetical protein VH142_28205, partial [Polyangiaceae bacterium]|nr:hypothetical protein [Polyangiaceae bacterium]